MERRLNRAARIFGAALAGAGHMFLPGSVWARLGPGLFNASNLGSAFVYAANSKLENGR